MTTPRDVDVQEWLRGIGFHPADTEVKQMGHELARQLIGEIGVKLAYLLPSGRDKSLVFTALEDALMRANRALAIGKGPHTQVTAGSLRAMLEEAKLGDASLPEDDRIEEYKAQQRERAASPHNWSDGTIRDYAETEANKGLDEIEGVRAEHYPRWDGQQPLPDDVPEEYDGTVATDDQEIKIDLHSSRASGRVQLGVLCTNPKRVEEAFTEGGSPKSGQFDGFYAGFTNPDHLSAFLREVAAAGQVVFGDPRELRA